MRKIHRAFHILLVLVVVALLLLAFAPWKGWLAAQLVRTLERQGVAPLSLTVENITTHGAVLSGITLGEKQPVTLNRLTLAFTPQELREGHLRTLEIEDVALTAWREQGRLYFSGLGELGGGKSAEPSPWLPPGPEELARIPFASVSIAGSEFNYLDNGLRVKMPFSAALKQGRAPEVSLESPGITMTGGACPLTTGKLALSGKPVFGDEELRWSGPFTLLDITPACAKGEVLKADIAGSWRITRLRLSAEFTVSQQKYQARTHWRLMFPLAASGGPELFLQDGSLVWNGGRISAKAVEVPLDGKSPLRAVVQLESLPLAEVMQRAAGGKVTATGNLSGSLPITYYPDGRIELGAGGLSSEAAGVLSLSADAIPDNGNAQIALVRQLLSNFHYRNLGLSLDAQDPKRPSLRLRLEGANPDVLGGHDVNLNVNLTGDVVNLIKDSIAAFDDPKALLKGNRHEKN